jgi:hypothetical protein
MHFRSTETKEACLQRLQNHIHGSTAPDLTVITEEGIVTSGKTLFLFVT